WPMTTRPIRSSSARDSSRAFSSPTGHLQTKAVQPPRDGGRGRRVARAGFGEPDDLRGERRDRRLDAAAGGDLLQARGELALRQVGREETGGGDGAHGLAIVPREAVADVAERGEELRRVVDERRLARRAL